MCHVVQEWRVAALERLEIHRCILRRALLPTPREAAAPCEGSGPHGGLRCLPLLASRLRIDLGPEGLPRRCRRPRHARLAQDRWTREAPGHPGLLATAFCPWRQARLCLEVLGRGEAFPLVTEGAEEA